MLSDVRAHIAELEHHASELEADLGAYWHAGLEDDDHDAGPCSYGTEDMTIEDPASPLVCPHGYMVELQEQHLGQWPATADEAPPNPPKVSGWVDPLEPLPFNVLDYTRRPDWVHELKLEEAKAENGQALLDTLVLPFTEPAGVDMPALPTRTEAGAAFRQHYKDVERELRENGFAYVALESVVRQAAARLTTAERRVLNLDQEKP